MLQELMKLVIANPGSPPCCSCPVSSCFLSSSVGVRLLSTRLMRLNLSTRLCVFWIISQIKFLKGHRPFPGSCSIPYNLRRHCVITLLAITWDSYLANGEGVVGSRCFHGLWHPSHGRWATHQHMEFARKLSGSVNIIPRPLGHLRLERAWGDCTG